MTQDLLLPVLDGVVLLALGVTGFFVVRLARQVRGLRQGKAEMERHVAELGVAAGRAEAALATLRRMADDTGKRLENQLVDARELLEELRFMAEAADRIASRLEQSGTQARKAIEAREDIREDVAPPVAPAQEAVRTKVTVAAMEERIRARAQGYLDKLSAGLAATASGNATMEDASLRGLRSRAERELAQAMRIRRAS